MNVVIIIMNNLSNLPLHLLRIDYIFILLAHRTPTRCETRAFAKSNELKSIFCGVE